MYLTCVSYGQTLAYARSVAKDSKYTHIARQAARGVYDLFTLQDTPVHPGQAEFIIRDTDRHLGTPHTS